MASAADLRRVAPEFAGLAEDVVEAFLADAAREVNPGIWGGLTNRAIVLLACHDMAANRPELYRGNAVTSEKAGEVSASYATPPTVSGDWATSRYGLTLRRLLLELGLTPTVI